MAKHLTAIRKVYNEEPEFEIDDYKVIQKQESVDSDVEQEYNDLSHEISKLIEMANFKSSGKESTHTTNKNKDQNSSFSIIKNNIWELKKNPDDSGIFKIKYKHLKSKDEQLGDRKSKFLRRMTISGKKSQLFSPLYLQQSGFNKENFSYCTHQHLLNSHSPNYLFSMNNNQLNSSTCDQTFNFSGSIRKSGDNSSLLSFSENNFNEESIRLNYESMDKSYMKHATKNEENFFHNSFLFNTTHTNDEVLLEKMLKINHTKLTVNMHRNNFAKQMFNQKNKNEKHQNSLNLIRNIDNINKITKISLDEDRKRINLENILKGKDKRTTIMIRNIPNKYKIKTFLEDINKHFVFKYDLFYLPIDYQNHCNLGFAFINFVDPMHIIMFYDKFRGKKWKRFHSEKICELAYAKFQGKKELINHFEKGSILNVNSDDKKPIILPTPDPLPTITIPKKYLEAFLAIYPYSSYILTSRNFEVDSLFNF